MSKGMMWLVGILGAVALIAMWLISASNNIPRQEAAVDARWASVEAGYQRRLNLIDNLVETVKGYASHENSTLTAVIEARAKASSFTVSKDIVNDPQALANFQAAQSGLSGALSRISMLTENYPNLKADKMFISLNAEIVSTENKIEKSIRDYTNSVQVFNTTLSTFPGNVLNSMFFGKEKKANFKAEEGAKTAPKVNFSK